MAFPLGMRKSSGIFQIQNRLKILLYIKQIHTFTEFALFSPS